MILVYFQEEPSCLVNSLFSLIHKGLKPLHLSKPLPHIYLSQLLLSGKTQKSINILPEAQ